MKVTIESQICEWDDPTIHVFVRFCNIILLHSDFTSLKSVLNSSLYKKDFEDYFAWDFTPTCLLVYQKNKYSHKIIKPCLLRVDYETENSNFSIGV